MGNNDESKTSVGYVLTNNLPVHDQFDGGSKKKG